MWTCPRCGRRFANRNQWHSCGRTSERQHLRGASPEVAAIYRRFAAMVRRCGPVTVEALTTRIGFKARTTFAAVSLGRDRLRAHVILRRRLESRRFTRVQSYSPGSHEHGFEIRRLEDLDDEVQGWLCEAYAAGGGPR